MCKKYILFLLVTVITSLLTHAQPNITDFRSELAKATTDSQKLRIYKSIYDFYSGSPTDSAKVYLEQGLRTFEASEYLYGKASMQLLLSNIYNERGLLLIAREKGLQALDIFRELKEERNMGRAHNAIGNAESYLGNYPEAFKHFHEALKCFEQIADTPGLINTYLELGAANDFNSNHDKALGYYNKALNMTTRTVESANTVFLYNNIGLYHARKGQFDKALQYFEKSEQIGRNPKYAKARLSPLTNIGKVYNVNGDDKKALEYMYMALDLSKTLKTREPACRVLLEIGLIESKNNPPDISSLEEGLAIARQIDSKRLQSEFLSALAEVADRTGNYKEEVSLLKQAKVLRDSIFDLDKAKEIANMEIEYELKRAHTQLSELEKAERRNAVKKNIIILIAVILAATLLTLIVFYTRSRILNKKLSARERDLKKANAIKDRLFSIIGHDLKGPIGNIPSLLNIYKNQENSDVEKEYILKAMEESSQASLETLEKLLSWGKQQIKGSVFNPSLLDVGEIMQSKLRLLGVMAANKNITITNNIPPNTRINADENHFKFIVRNLLSNAVKFTHPGGHIEINATVQPGEPYVTFSVSDNGIGIDPEMQQHIFEPYNESTVGTANETGTSIGLMLCKEFVSQNGGDIWVESAKDKGATFYFYFKGRQAI